MIRPARRLDAEAMASIYAPFVTEGSTSFEAVAPDASAMARRLNGLVDGGYPWLVATDDDEVLGYAYGSPHRAPELPR